MHKALRTYLPWLALGALIAGAIALAAMRSDGYPYQGHRIPMDQLRTVDPHPGCEHDHYHAVASKSVQATDGSLLPDDNDCGYGPVR